MKKVKKINNPFRFLGTIKRKQQQEEWDYKLNMFVVKKGAKK